LNAGLSLNLKTGFLSVQYHVLYDETLMSVAGVDENQQQVTLDSVDWQSIIQHQGGSEIHYDKADIDFVLDHLNDDWLTPDEIQEKQDQRIMMVKSSSSSMRNDSCSQLQRR